MITRILSISALTVVAIQTPSVATAATIIALGASQTYGHGVLKGQDYPSQLQAMLRAKGLNVSVQNAGVWGGSTTAAMRSKLESVLNPDTKVVILQPGRKRGGDDRQENIGQIKQVLAERHIRLIMIPNRWFKEFPRQSDHQHLTAEGFQGLAQKLLPKVVAALH
ncbi:acyl-CoA thioesterase [Rhizobium sp. BR 314]|uniref:acyl-CoA thioesterase n=1 Tax=Rhizobium sp. BR 314 TaxID=3040013 RepID=UPI0039BF439A